MTERTVFSENQLRLLTLLFLLFAALMLLAGVLANEQRQTLKQADRLNDLASLAPTYSALIHELQKERGLSAGFIAGKGGKFGRLLPDQRAAADRVRVSPLDGHGTLETMPAELLEKVDVAAASLSRLEQIRQAVDTGGIPPDEMIAYYSATISDLLRVVRTIAMLSTDVGVSTTITAYTAFLQGKEHAGLERDTGALGYALQHFPTGLQRAFLETIAKQDAYFAVFVDYASPQQAAYFLETVTGSAVNEVDYMRRIAMSRPVAGPNSGSQYGPTEDIDAQYWFDTISRKIDLMKAVEERLSEDLQGQATAIRSNAKTLLLAYAVATVFLLLVTIGLAVATFIRMSQTRKVVRAVWHQANYDALTGLPNRGLLDDRLIGALAAARRNGTKVAVLFLDLDKFKPVNDTLGHAVGDLLLKEVANSLRNSVRETDTVARIGGDEFVAVLTNVHDRADVVNVAEKIIARLSHPFTLRAHTVDIGCSIGIAIYPDDDSDLLGLLEKADAAMYRVKRGGEPKYGFVPDVEQGPERHVDAKRGA
jgi:diguanylate cyclase (GGDEF)-like protein